MAWIAVQVETIRALDGWVQRLEAEDRLTGLERLIHAAGISDALGQLVHGVVLSQDETVRPADLGLEDAAATLAADPALRAFDGFGVAATGRAIVHEARRRQSFGDSGLDETLGMIADQFRGYVGRAYLPGCA